jgi:hypothetical protein
VERPTQIDPDDREFFDRGFVEIPDLFTRAEVERMRAAFDRLAVAAAGLEGTLPIRLIPGSCRHGHIQPDSDGRIPTRFIRERPAVTATMRAGSVLAFGPYTIHASSPNRSFRPRRVLINGFACPGANSRVYPGDGSGRVVTCP